MAVYERTYRRYDGPLTTPRWRFTVLPRYAFEGVWRSRIFLVFLLGCFIAPVIGLIAIYLHHNAGALLRLDIDLSDLVPIDGTFFLTIMSIQATAAYIMALYVGPALIATDLANNALPLFLSRPLTRREYVLGKALVLLALLSAITWVPGLVMFLFQGFLEGFAWMVDNLRIAGAIFAASWLWIIVLTLLSLAVSAWVRRRPVARGVLLALLFVPAALGAAINELLRTRWGTLLDLQEMVRVVWQAMFLSGTEGEISDLLTSTTAPIPVWAALSVLLLVCLVCLLLLWQKVRAYQVVRS